MTGRAPRGLGLLKIVDNRKENKKAAPRTAGKADATAMGDDAMSISRRSFAGASAAASAALVAGIGTASGQTVLRAAHSSNPGQSVFIYWEEFAKRVNAKSGGRMTVQVFPGGQLGGDEQIIQGIKAGTIQFGSASNGNLGTTTDAYYWCDLPHVFASRDGAIRALADRDVHGYLEGKLLSEARSVLLGHIEVGGFRIIVNRRREIRVPADLKGLKFRNLPTPIDRALWETWGAIPAPLAWSETFVSLEQGVIDGVALQPQALRGFKFDDIVKFGTMTGTLMAFHVAIASARTWEQLSAENRAVIRAAAEEAQAIANEADRRDEARFVSEMEARGIRFHRPSAEEAKLWSEPARALWKRFEDKINRDILAKVMAAQGG